MKLTFDENNKGRYRDEQQEKNETIKKLSEEKNLLLKMENAMEQQLINEANMQSTNCQSVIKLRRKARYRETSSISSAKDLEEQEKELRKQVHR
ncbi:hypothetical protein ACKWTF_008059 [Chironomus riparius]